MLNLQAIRDISAETGIRPGFVTAMSYADDDRIHFDDACSALERIVTVYHSPKEQI